MASTDTLSRMSPYAERLLDDYMREARLVREAGESVRKAALAAKGEQKPSRKPRILAALALTGVTAYFVKQLATSQAESQAR